MQKAKAIPMGIDSLSLSKQTVQSKMKHTPYLRRLLWLLPLLVAWGVLSYGKAGSEAQTDFSQSETVQTKEEKTQEEVVDYSVFDESCIGAGAAQAVYCNGEQKPLSLGNGRELRIGASSTDGDAIYLNPAFYYAGAKNAGEQYGFLLRAERGNIEYSSIHGTPAPRTALVNANETNLLIVGRTYDKLVPASYQNAQDYGVRWTADRNAEGAVTDACIVTMHVIRLSDGILMGCATAAIAYDSSKESFVLGEVHSSDVSMTGELSESKRDELIHEAAAFLGEGNGKMQLDYSEELIRNSRHLICVEKLTAPIFNRLFSTAGDAISAAAFRGYELYAVHLPYVGLGYLTVYFAPETQVNGLREAVWGNEGSAKLQPVGYDALSPFSEQSMESFLLPEDLDFFRQNR